MSDPSTVAPRYDRPYGPDTDWRDAFFVQDQDPADSRLGIAHDFAGETLTLYIWDATSDVQIAALTDGDGLTIGGSVAVKHPDGRNAGTATRVDYVYTDAQIRASEYAGNAWRYKLESEEAGRTLDMVRGEMPYDDFARPR